MKKLLAIIIAVTMNILILTPVFADTKGADLGSTSFALNSDGTSMVDIKSSTFETDQQVPYFVIDINNGNTLLQELKPSYEMGSAEKIAAMSFTDINNDGKNDIEILATYQIDPTQGHPETNRGYVYIQKDGKFIENDTINKAVQYLDEPTSIDQVIAAAKNPLYRPARTIDTKAKLGTILNPIPIGKTFSYHLHKEPWESLDGDYKVTILKTIWDQDQIIKTFKPTRGMYYHDEDFVAVQIRWQGSNIVTKYKDGMAAWQMAPDAGSTVGTNGARRVGGFANYFPNSMFAVLDKYDNRKTHKSIKKIDVTYWVLAKVKPGDYGTVMEMDAGNKPGEDLYNYFKIK